MTDEKIDRILAKEDELIPSSGFVGSVMGRIREEVAAPPPIPFPWRRVVPGLVLAGVGLGWAAVEVGRQAIATVHSAQPVVVQIPDAILRPVQGLGWTALAVGISLVSWGLARRISGESRLL